jgi:hypothetical protein
MKAFQIPLDEISLKRQLNAARMVSHEQLTQPPGFASQLTPVPDIS